MRPVAQDRLEEYRRIAAFNRKCGVDVLEIGPRDVESLFPLCRVDDVLAGFYVKEARPHRSHTHPGQLCSG